MTQKIIYTTSEGGVAVVHPTGEVPINRLVAMVVPEELSHFIVEVGAIPTDSTFRNAWTIVGGVIEEDLTKSIVIAHDMRRRARDKEFMPYDEVISKQIPGTDLVAVEASREEIRTRYASIQTNIDSASTVAAVKSELLVQGIIS